MIELVERLYKKEARSVKTLPPLFAAFAVLPLTLFQSALPEGGRL